MITFTLTQEEANAIYQLVGQLPTISNAHPLFVQPNGTLSNTPSTPSVFAGTAVSATKLIVKG